MRTQLLRVIEERLVTIAFQPIISLDHPGILAYEALTRPDTDSGFETPDQLFDAAEREGLIWELESVTRRAALEAAADWPAGVALFLNSTPKVIADDRFTPAILEEVREIGGLNAGRIVLEVTERSENDHVEGLQRQTAALQKHGFQIAIDDVGAGTSGLNRIMLLRPQWLKLDRALISNIDQDPVRTNLIRFLTHFGRLSGVSIVGEGVERPEELQRLLMLGVNAAQGYLIGKPGRTGQTLDNELSTCIHEHRIGNIGSIFHRDRHDTIADLSQPCVVAHAKEPVSRVRGAIAGDTGLLGVVVNTDSATPGWCPRESVLTAEESAELGGLAVPFARTVSVHEKIDSLLEIASSFETGDLETPIGLTEPSRAIGVTRVRDLLRAGSAVCRAVRHRSATLTGLPGRVRCEEEIIRALREDANRDAVFVDIRNISEYNAVFGFELGDQLITNLVEAIEQATREVVGNDSEAAFLGHLGDDRLMLVTDSGIARRVARPAIDLFEARVVASGISPQVALSGIGEAPAIAGISLRYLILPGIKKLFSTPQELMQTEPILRAMANEQAAIDPTRTGYIVEAPSEEDPEGFLLAA